MLNELIGNSSSTSAPLGVEQQKGKAKSFVYISKLPENLSTFGPTPMGLRSD